MTHLTCGTASINFLLMKSMVFWSPIYTIPTKDKCIRRVHSTMYEGIVCNKVATKVQQQTIEINVRKIHICTYTFACNKITVEDC